jgi:peptidoglycan hydrolase CwlO-like protein
MNDDPTYNGDFQEWIPMHAKPIVTSSNIPLIPSLTDDALEQVTNYIGKLQNTIHDLEEKLDDAVEEIADYIEMIDEKNEIIQGQAKFIDILQRQIAIAETYLVKRLDSTK